MMLEVRATGGLACGRQCEGIERCSIVAEQHGNHGCQHATS